MKKYIEQMGIESDRLKLEWISASEGKQFAELIDSMTARILELGPSKIKQVVDTLAV
jgi:F420-non-reducing hydrogenase iron-sulfur subunit